MNQDPDIGSDQQAGCPAPRARYDLIGHETAELSFAKAWDAGRLHHAWLITGPRGIGKASLAWRAIRRVLGAHPMSGGGPLASDPNDPVCRTLEADANPDMLVIRRPWNDKRKRWRAEITIDEARKASAFFEKSAGAGGWRACLVDSADDMNNNSANALLKTLEEPPHRGVLFLISHSPGRLPATIRSRCRRLSLASPNVEQSAAWLVKEAGLDDSAQAHQALDAALNSPGRALELLGNGGLDIHARVASLVEQGASLSDGDARRLADNITARGQDGLQPAFYEALKHGLERQAIQAARENRDAEPWLNAWRSLARLVRDADALYLDPRQAALAALSLSRTAAKQAQL